MIEKVTHIDIDFHVKSLGILLLDVDLLGALADIVEKGLDEN